MRCNGQELCAFIRAEFESLVLGIAETEPGEAVQSPPFRLHVSLPHTLQFGGCRRKTFLSRRNLAQNSSDATILPIHFMVSIPASNYWVSTQNNKTINSKPKVRVPDCKALPR